MTQDSRPAEEHPAKESPEAGPDAIPEEPGSEEEGSSLPQDALYSPEDPIATPEGEIPDDAIFSPDDPLTRSEGGEGVVTGMGGSTDGTARKGRGLEWELRYTADLLKNLERGLREQGMEALRVHPDVEPMDAMLRSFIAGFLVGRMEEEG